MKCLGHVVGFQKPLTLRKQRTEKEIMFWAVRLEPEILLFFFFFFFCWWLGQKPELSLLVKSKWSVGPFCDPQPLLLPIYYHTTATAG
jgi:hypothetical protein